MLTMEPFWLGSQTKIQEIKVFRNRLDVNSLWKLGLDLIDQKIGQFICNKTEKTFSLIGNKTT